LKLEDGEEVEKEEEEGRRQVLGHNLNKQIKNFFEKNIKYKLLKIKDIIIKYYIS